MRISVKLLWISEAVLLVAVLALLIPMLVRMKDQVVRQMQLELRSIAVNAAPLLDGDLHEQIAAGGPGREAAFAALRARLHDIRVRNPDPMTGKPFSYEHLYTFYRDGDIVRFGVMDHPTPFIGDPYELRTDMIGVLENGEPVETALYTDEHGQWISAYAPIRNSAGEVVGLLAADRSSAQYFMALRDVTWLAVAIGFVALVLSSLLGWHVLNAVVIRPMRKIRDGVTALGARNFSHRVDLRTGDEFQSLGETLNDISTQLDAAKVVQAGKVTHLESHRPPLGLDIDLGDAASQTTLHLERNDRVLFASDGLSEAFDANGNCFGTEPIERAMIDAALDCGQVVERLRSALMTHCKGPSRTDDVTILCVDRVARGAHGHNGSQGDRT